MTLTHFKTQLNENPKTIKFTDVMHLIDTLYQYTPTAFENGLNDDVLINAEGTNEGSCKLFAFAKNQNLNAQQTLYCFGQYYTDDVLKNPNADNHQNIRHFMKYGWEGIRFKQAPLLSKN